MTPEISLLSDKAQVFVSYGRGDAEMVLQISRMLEDEGASVWRDGDRILGGQYYGEEIVHAIAHSRVVLLMCSPHSLQSDNVHREVLLTWDYYHRRYIPVWLTPVMEIPERFRYCLAGCQWIDAHSPPPEKWLPQLLKALKAAGVDTKVMTFQSGEVLPASAPTPAPAPTPLRTPGPADASVEAERRGPRFSPGDRPVRGTDWELERLLGKGGFGEVWKAKNPELPAFPPVALKFCLQLDDRSKALLRHEADMVLRAQQQFRAGGIANASGIVPLAHTYLNNDPPCLEYPYIEGGTLVRLIEVSRESTSTGSLKPAQAQQIVQRVAQIVSAAHRATPKLVHRDLKPSNILVERRGDAKMVLRVTDFGIGGLAAQPALERSRSTSLQENMASVLTGSYSPLYASPQQMRGDKPDPRDDVYALGVIWYQLLTGDLASPAPTGLRWAEPLRQKGMSDEALHLLSSCFESNPAHRPGDAGELAKLLEPLPLVRLRECDPPRRTSEPALDIVGRGFPDPARMPDGRSPEQDSDRKEPRPPEDSIVGRGSPDPARMPDRRSPGQDPAPTDPRPPEASARRSVVPEPRAHRVEPAASLARSGSVYDWFISSRRWAAPGLLGLVALLGVVVYIATDNGTVKITGSDPRMKISIDGNKVTIDNLGKPITFRTGTHKFEADYDDVRFKTDSFQVRRSAETVLDVTYVPKVPIPDPSKTEQPKPTENTPARVENKPPPSAPPAKPAITLQPEYRTTRVGQIKLRLIPSGTFQMGSHDGGGKNDEHPQHQVTITRPFYLGVYEVTQAQYEAVTGQNPSYFSHKAVGKNAVAGQSTDQLPVENVSWLDAVKFCNLLSEKEGLRPFYQIGGETVRVLDWNAPGFRLPTEAEWEYACRAGNAAAYCFGADASQLGEYAWYDGISRANGTRCTHPVGRKLPNGFKVHDMHGNVWEWCWDWYDEAYYKQSPVEDPRGPDAASGRVNRGGGWDDGAGNCRSAYRLRGVPADRDTDLGFRLALGQSGD
jgi:formylglycine-generating enzyme required for sulfatase activity/serine/threonine protein kinase